MITLHQEQNVDILKLGRSLFSNRSQRGSLKSFEQAAKLTVNQIYDTFAAAGNEKEADGSPKKAFALVRVFRFCKADDAPPEVQPEALQRGPNDTWLCLAATRGSLPEWSDRTRSAGHQLISLNTTSTPMLTAAFEQLGIIANTSRALDTGKVVMYASSLETRYFHVEKAPGSPFIPAQTEFVLPYGIKSVVGLGSPFISGSGFMMLCFAKTEISTEAAWGFAQISPFVSTLLALYDARRPLWEAAKQPA
jgi:two-component system, NtrC family, sensor kinase